MPHMHANLGYDEAKTKGDGKMNKKVLERAKVLDKKLSLPAGAAITMSLGEQHICTRLNLIVSLLTLLLDEVDK